MEGRQSKCNYCIHMLLGCSHFPSCAFKSECENRTLGLLQRFVGLVLLELFRIGNMLVLKLMVVLGTCLFLVIAVLSSVIT